MGFTSDFWQGKRFLVTGHTGFKGSWLSLWLQMLGADVVGYSLPAPTTPSLFECARVEDGIASIIGDVRDFETLLSTFQEHRPSTVIHMAAQSLVRRSYAEPLETYSTNVLGTVNVLEAARRTGTVKAILVVSSDKCYENNEWAWPYRENDRLGGHDPYSSSKACAELVTAAYRTSFFDATNGSKPAPLVATVRAGNVIGGGDWSQDRLIPDCIRAFAAGRSVQLRYPHAVRPWQHVLGPLSGYLLLAEQLLSDDGHTYSGPWNFGPDAGESLEVGEVAQRVGRLWGDGKVTFSEDPSLVHEACLLRLDTTKALARLRWRQRWRLDRALEETVSWYKAWHQGKDMRAYTLDQISAYEARNESTDFTD